MRVRASHQNGAADADVSFDLRLGGEMRVHLTKCACFSLSLRNSLFDVYVKCLRLGQIQIVKKRTYNNKTNKHPLNGKAKSLPAGI